MNDSKFINSSSSAPPLKLFPKKKLTRVIQSSIASFWKRSLDEKLPGHKSVNNFDSLHISKAGFKFIFIYFSQQNPSDNQNTVLFPPQTSFFPFFSFFFCKYAKQENTQCNKTEDSDSAVLSLPFHSARLYTQRDCTSSLLHFRAPPTNVMDRAK